MRPKFGTKFGTKFGKNLAQKLAQNLAQIRQEWGKNEAKYVTIPIFVYNLNSDKLN